MIEFLGKNVKTDHSVFDNCRNLKTVSFPNADNLCLNMPVGHLISDEFKFLVRRDANISGDDIDKLMHFISYIEKDPIQQNICKKDDKENKSKSSEEDLLTQINDLKEEKVNLNDYISYLVNHLSKYEQVISYDEFIKNPKSSQSKIKEKQIFISSEDEKFQKVVSKIGEGSTCEVFKVIDERTGKVMCKKVIKECKDEEKFKMMQNSFKEAEVLLRVDHPCICKAIGFNIVEDVLPPQKKSNDGDDDDDEFNEEEEKQPKTTIALFFELLPYSVKDVIDKGMMNNTLKVRIAIEVAFGMSHIHSLLMMHRDLKLENIMMNNIFESKIIDFGLVRTEESFGFQSSLTKGVGTLAYMSPEMVNEENYDNKTDVYSYGIVLFALFVGRLPKQSMKDKLNNVPIKFPQPSSKISSYCIELIKKCTSFDPSKRPTFNEIIDDIYEHSFNLASEVDIDIINLRYQALNLLRA